MKFKFYHVLSFLVSIALIVFLLSFIDLGNFGSILTHIDPLNYIFALLTYFLAYLIRAVRLWELFDKKNLDRYVLFVSIHQVLNRVMPFRSGEIFFPILIKKMTGIRYSEGISKLLILRLLDLISLVLSFLLVCVFVDFGFSNLQFTIILCLFIVLLFALFTLKYLFPFALDLMGKIVSTKYKEKLSGFSTLTKDAFNIKYKKFFILALYSVADKFINYLMCFFALKSLGYDFTIKKIISANTMSGITEILPVNSLGSFGTTELGWAGALIYTGVDKQTAIESGFGFNILAFSFTILLGVLGFCITRFYYKIKLFKNNG